MDAITIKRELDAPIGKVWHALTDVGAMRQWYFPMLEDFRPRVGFETEFVVSHNGKDFPHIWKVTEAQPKKVIAYDWRFGGYPGNSNLRFTLIPDGDKTELKLEHVNLSSFEPQKHPELSAGNFKMGWEQLLAGLVKFLE